jgi:transposase-like protein
MTTATNLCGVPRRSSYVIVLNSEERGSLERTAALLKAPFREVQRARIILDAAAGFSDAEIARRRDCTTKTVGKWRRRFCEERLEGLRDEPRAGRPRRFPPGTGSAGQGGRVRAAERAWRSDLAVLSG